MSEDGDTYVIQAGPEFKVLGKNSLDEMTLATPAVAQRQPDHPDGVEAVSDRERSTINRLRSNVVVPAERARSRPNVTVRITNVIVR